LCHVSPQSTYSKPAVRSKKSAQASFAAPCMRCVSVPTFSTAQAYGLRSTPVSLLTKDAHQVNPPHPVSLHDLDSLNVPYIQPAKPDGMHETAGSDCPSVISLALPRAAAQHAITSIQEGYDPGNDQTENPYTCTCINTYNSLPFYHPSTSTQFSLMRI
jgi:hypothetical protein